MNQSKSTLKRKWVGAVIAVLLAFAAVGTATFAWYIYNTSAHTTKLHMAAGTSASLKICSSYDGSYGTKTNLEDSMDSSFVGRLNPVSTNSILGGFQKVFGFTDGSDTQSSLVANLFGSASSKDFYKSTLFLKTNGADSDVYVADIGFDDSDPDKPISTAIRIGLVVHEPGQDMPATEEFIYAISDESNPEAEYNTMTGEEGYVLDSSKTDGTTVEFTPLTEDNWCVYDDTTGSVTLKTNSQKICEVSGNNGDYGTPVQVDVYIWLEGCDEDCVENLCDTTLKDIAIIFAAA